MKRQLITLTIASGLTLSSIAAVHAGDRGDGKGPHGHGGWGNQNPMEQLTDKLNLTREQQAKVQPIVDQAKPQLQSIHQEAMQKAKLVMDSAMEQLRPILTPEQLQKLEAMRQEHEQKRGKGRQ
ncbi:MAG: periplasmic heavy metal sensor [Chthoniobacterales bacterium]|nr:periplasmic heavy metal sensor [Chthoniobacterales bacterium]